MQSPIQRIKWRKAILLLAAALAFVVACAAIPGIQGAGTTNTVPLWTGSTTLGNSVLTQSGGNLSASGGFTAASLTGDGTAVTNVNAAKLGGILPGGFAQLAAGGNAFSGGITAASFAGDGSALTNVNAAKLDGIAASAFAVLGANNTFTGSNTFMGPSGTPMAFQVIGGDGSFVGPASAANGGGIAFTAGSGVLGSAAGVGGAVTLTGGNGAVGGVGAIGGVGGAVTLTAGNSGDSPGGAGVGAGVTLTAGNGGSSSGFSSSGTAGAGGNVTITSGNAGSTVGPAAADGGGILIAGGNGGQANPKGGNGGSITLRPGGGGSGVSQGSGSPGDVILAPSGGLVGVGTATPGHTLEVVAGGSTLADAWTTRSSRLLKTNIQPLEGALEKVQQLRGVSYDSKTDGKHQIGVIAEEVGEVLPEVVSYAPNGVDARGVDYGRLTALLIEAVKSQQTEIRELKQRIEQLTSKTDGK